MTRWMGSVVASFMLLAACAGDPAGTDPGDDDPVVPPVPDDTTAVLELYALDLWAQPLPDDATLTIIRNAEVVQPLGDGVRYVALRDPGTYHVTLAAPDHDTLQVDVVFDGSSNLDGVDVTGGDPLAGVAASHDLRDVGDLGVLPVHTVYLGLRHQWFSAEGRPARRGNELALFVDGETAWAAVEDQIDTADRSIEMAYWWWQSAFELRRNADGAAAPQHEVLARLEASPALKRVLVGQFISQDGILSTISSDSALRSHGDVAGDDFEYMGQANTTHGQFRFELPAFGFGDRVRAAHAETDDRAFDAEAPIESTVPPHDVDLTQWPVTIDAPAASWHQKFAVFDDAIAFVGGMNLQKNDWDTSAHVVDDPRRHGMPPRKDYMVRIDGPAVQDVEDVFARRWDLARDEGVDYSENTTPFTPARDQVAHADGVQLQVTTTMPAPLWEHSIVETWLNAVRHATDYIFIEDQYFRAPILTDAILARMAEVPTLKLVVVTDVIDEWTDPGCAWTYRTNARIREQLGADRYMLLQLRSFATGPSPGWDEVAGNYQDIYIHSKVMIVDDKFLSVGSANKNNRGVIYEGEMSLAIVDPIWVRDARRRMIHSMLGYDPSDDSDDWWAQLANEAAWNDWVAANWDAEGGDISLDGAPLPDAYAPVGFVYSMSFPDVSECLFEDIGPDQT